MYNEHIAHSGTLGMKWGRRLYQNKDGSLTPLGRLRYGSGKDFRAGKPRTVKSATGQKNKSESESSEEESEQDYYKRMKTKKASELTDAELNRLSNRLQAENLYNTRLKENMPPAKESRVKKLIADQAEKAARDISNKAIEAVGERVKKAILGDKEEAITKITKNMDLSNVSDAALKKMVERAQNENKLKSAVNFGKDGAAKKNDAKTETKETSEKKDESKFGTVEDGPNESTGNAKGVRGQQWGKRESNVVDGDWRDVTENPGSNNGSMTRLLAEESETLKDRIARKTYNDRGTKLLSDEAGSLKNRKFRKFRRGK